MSKSIFKCFTIHFKSFELNVVINDFRMLFKGYKKPLVFDDMTELRESDTCRSIVPLFEKAWYGKVRDSDPELK